MIDQLKSWAGCHVLPENTLLFSLFYFLLAYHPFSRAGIEPALSGFVVRIDTILIVSFFFAVREGIYICLSAFGVHVALLILVFILKD